MNPLLPLIVSKALNRCKHVAGELIISESWGCVCFLRALPVERDPRGGGQRTDVAPEGSCLPFLVDSGI